MIEANQKKPYGLFKFVLGVILFLGVFLAMVSIISYLNSEGSENSTSEILNGDTVQFKIRKEEYLFRDEIFKEVGKFYRSDNLSLIDSIYGKNGEKNDITHYILLSKLKNDKSISRFKLSLKEPPTSGPFLRIESIVISFKIDFDKLGKIINSSGKTNIREDSIKYGNFISTSYKIQKKVNWEYVIITLFVIIVILTSIYFYEKIKVNNRKTGIDKTIADYESDKNIIKQVEEDLTKENITMEERDKLKNELEKIEINFKSYQIEQIAESVLYGDVVKAERKANDLSYKSNLMMILGLLTAVVGILVFYISLPQLNQTANYQKYLLLTIRPTLILIFVQSISFYLLRQYRLLINDYKYFHSEYIIKSQIFTSYQIMQKSSINEYEKKLIDNILDKKIIKENESNSNDELNSNNILEIIKLIVNKIKSE